MKIMVSGLCGYMGKELQKLLEDNKRNITLECGVDAFVPDDYPVPCTPDFDSANTEVDCIIDFSHHSQTKPLLDFATKNSIPLVLATTGQTEEEKEYIIKASKKIPLFFAANYSLGVALLIELAKKTAEMMPDADIEIIEHHHNRKLDAPSGTALAIADAIKEVRKGSKIISGRSGKQKREPEDIGVSSVRMGNIVGIHEVLVGTASQTITLKHEAHSRALFAEGALSAAEFLFGKAPGLYNMNDMIK